jgi:hypothetical protein
MQIKNNYAKEVFNGNIGRIITLDLEMQKMKVRFDDRVVVYEYDDLDELVLAIAVNNAKTHQKKASAGRKFGPSGPRILHYCCQKISHCSSMLKNLLRLILEHKAHPDITDPNLGLLLKILTTYQAAIFKNRHKLGL